MSEVASNGRASWLKASLTLAILVISTASASCQDLQNACVYGSGRKAIESCTKYLRRSNLDPGDRDLALASRAQSHMIAGDFSKAIDDYSSHLHGPNPPPLLYAARSEAHSQLGHFDAALEDADQAVKSVPKSADAYVSRARALEGKGEVPGALESIDKAIKIDPKRFYEHVVRARIFQRLGRHDDAIAAAKTAVAKKRQFAKSYVLFPYEAAALSDLSRSLSQPSARNRPAENVSQVVAPTPSPQPLPVAVSVEPRTPVKPGSVDKRVALVIGNVAYQHADRLTNPLTDARNMRDALTRLGFEVVYGEDVDQRAMRHLLGKFADVVNDADVAIVYYAGHGATFGGVPYIVPTDAEFASAGNMPYELVPVETLIGELRRAKGVRIAILDACRDNEAEKALKRTATRSLGDSHGLAPVRDAHGLIVAYGTAYNATASDGEPNGDSPFTAALLKHIERPGITIQEMFFDVARDVIKQTKDEQRPEISVSLFEPYMLAGPGNRPMTSTALSPAVAAPPSASSPAPVVSSAHSIEDDGVTRAIKADADYRRFFDRLRVAFPSEYDTIMKSLVASHGRGGNVDLDAAMSNAVSALRRSRGSSAARAADDALDRIFAMQLEQLRALQANDPRLCVDFLFGQNGIGFLAFAADHRRLVADAAITGLDAMTAGEADRIHREVPSEADFQILERRLIAKGLSRPEIEALLDAKSADPPIANERMCAAGQTYLETLATMPAQTRAKLYSLAVDLMAKS